MYSPYEQQKVVWCLGTTNETKIPDVIENGELQVITILRNGSKDNLETGTQSFATEIA